MTEKGIFGDKLRHLELIRRVEMDRMEREKSVSLFEKERKIAEKDFGERWMKLLQAYADRPDNGIFLESVVFSKPKLK